MPARERGVAREDPGRPTMTIGELEREPTTKASGETAGAADGTTGATGEKAGATDGTAGNGWRRRPSIGRAGGWLLRVITVLALAWTGAWAWYSNVTVAKPSMQMSVRSSAATAAFPVVTALVERGTVAGSVTYTGSVAPFAEEDIFPRVTGRIVEMPAYPGDAVRAGQVLARLDDVELSSRVREAEATAASA